MQIACAFQKELLKSLVEFFHSYSIELYHATYDCLNESNLLKEVVFEIPKVKHVAVIPIYIGDAVWISRGAGMGNEFGQGYSHLLHCVTCAGTAGFVQVSKLETQLLGFLCFKLKLLMLFMLAFY